MRSRGTSQLTSWLFASSLLAVTVGCLIRNDSQSASASPALCDADINPALSPLARSGGAGDIAPLTAPAALRASSIPSLLSSGLVRVSVKRGVVESMEVSSYNANPAIEDSYVIEPLLQSEPTGVCAVVGVFDGHSGAAASTWLRHHLLPYLIHHRQTGRTTQLLHPDAFLAADSHFLETSWASGRPADGLSGACYNVVQLSDSGEVRCAGAGDVRAIIGRRRVAEGAVGAVRDGRPHSTHIAVPLSWDHQIDANPGERERLLAAHPNEPDVIRRNRVKGRLQPTRGFGDGAYKQQRYFQLRAQTQPTNSRASTTAYTPPYTTGATHSTHQ